ncbi:hypothetical protein AUEXF2481DRAFT_36932 [Aureobasidium subglaciale EXF-2481]|uniref:BZIP domain-containing protein n=1 Tax=Aureobasidium subglaciale (strain EXF-2481) TaxID=1043005 RepID=A0A074YKR3_AURSE|nr:uncharacterized protein AUEXF2481DRAFT_36932 [Aureobasidium subglaciale EXF-2481]KAI5211796.1 hypothetical protein E4T38_00939 [Aureobasidium subglaciale]KAI5230831.1 hypothetical protein E4T40_00940 [Aureobasidium subglaciale]KAI5233901.1 hypothetical protein E4T41_00938 [Aureobasidium subglaciale]KAI5267167.1 hypothetical protein E4T46_00938 [Aureobasidium subglaciale]KEQ98423.1 hypothetical protein AUEXF2481DRAFT_36932 [Aureobasidium subglaciale EXF-2481]
MSAALSRIDLTQPERITKRKRSKDAPDSNNEESRKRGRPRLETEGESAADKRRQQVRLAQRNYRQRKENTIDELKKQVQELQSTIQSMNQTFSHFSERCSATNVSPIVLDEVQSIAQLYSAGQSRADSLSMSNSPEIESLVIKPPSSTSGRERSSPLTTNESDTSPRTEVKHWSPLTAPVSALNMPDGIDNDPASFSILRSLGIPSTYSSFERTFARRLHRASCEYAYRLACDPARVPILFNNVFKLTLKAAGTVDRLKYSLRSTLSRSTKEPLSNWGVTYIHVGGAGTHYARPPEEGGLSYMSPTSWAVTTVGPHKIGGSTIEEALTAEMLLRGVTGMDGEWFDAYDVEGYLAEKGIRLDPSSSFAEIELPDDEPSGPGYSVASPPMDAITAYVQSLTTSGAESVSAHPTYYPGLSEAGHMPTLPAIQPQRKSYPVVQTYFQSQVDERRSTAPTVDQQYGTMPMTDHVYPYARQPARKARVTIDVGKFIEHMSMAGTCLMRAPGYRRKDIDVALRRSAVAAH